MSTMLHYTHCIKTVTQHINKCYVTEDKLAYTNGQIIWLWQATIFVKLQLLLWRPQQTR